MLRKRPEPAQAETSKKIQALEHTMNVQMLARNANLGGNTSSQNTDKTKIALDRERKELKKRK